MSSQLPCNVLKCGKVFPKDGDDFITLKNLMIESPENFKTKVGQLSRTKRGYSKITNHIQRNPDFHESLLKIAIILQIYDIIQWFCDQNLLIKACKHYSIQFMTLAVPDQKIVSIFLKYGFCTFLKPLDYSQCLYNRFVSPLLQSISYLNYDLTELMTKYPCVMPNIQVVLMTDDNIDLLFTKVMEPMENISLFINKNTRKLYRAIMYENNRKREFFVNFPYVYEGYEFAQVRRKLRISSPLFQTLLSILYLLFSKGSSIAFSSISDDFISSNTMLYNVVYKSSSIENSEDDLQFIHNIFPFTSSPRSLQRECYNAIKLHLLLWSGLRQFSQRVDSLPIPLAIKDYLKS